MSRFDTTREGEGREPIAGDVGDRVQAVIRRAEQLADAIREDAELRRREADREAEERLDEARREADRMLADQAAWISSLRDELAERADVLVAELDTATDARRRLDRFVRELARVGDALGELGASEPSSPEPANAPEPASDEAARKRASPPRPKKVEGAIASTSPSAEPAKPTLVGDAASSVADANGTGTRSAVEPPSGDSDSLDGARLVAFQMAIAGSKRDEVAAHLRRTFGISEPQAILDDAFGSAGSSDRGPAA